MCSPGPCRVCAHLGPVVYVLTWALSCIRVCAHWALSCMCSPGPCRVCAHLGPVVYLCMCSPGPCRVCAHLGPVAYVLTWALLRMCSLGPVVFSCMCSPVPCRVCAHLGPAAYVLTWALLCMCSPAVYTDCHQVPSIVEWFRVAESSSMATPYLLTWGQPSMMQRLPSVMKRLHERSRGGR